MYKRLRIRNVFKVEWKRLFKVTSNKSRFAQEKHGPLNLIMKLFFFASQNPFLSVSFLDQISIIRTFSISSFSKLKCSQKYLEIRYISHSIFT